MLTLQALVGALRAFYGPLPMPPEDAFAFYLWEVLGLDATPGRRDAAMAALRRIPALTPEAVARAAPARVEQAVALAGPHKDDRLRAVRAGVEFFRRHPEVGAALRGSREEAVRTIAGMPRVAESTAGRMLLFAGGHAVLPADSSIERSLARLGVDPHSHPGTDAPGEPGPGEQVRDRVAGDFGGDVAAVRTAAVYLAHHAAVTCTAHDPRCRVCPVLAACPEGMRRTPMHEPPGSTT